MTFMPNPLASTTRLPRLLALGTLAPRATFWGSKLVAADLAAVRRISAAAERSPAGRMFAVAISKLGNGRIYPILAAIIFAAWGWDDGKRMILLAAANAALTHVLYPIIKRRFKRLRPFKVDPRVPSLLDTLDEHSFPSGHAMPLTGVLVPIVLVWPGCFGVALALIALMGWARIASGHHYPTDICAGAALGFGMSYPLSVWILAA